MSYSHRSRVPPLACSGKYDPLAYHLNGLTGDEWRASFREIEAVPGFTLPRSARVYQAWWANKRNPSQSQKLAWTKAGWEVSTVTPMAGQVAFRRVGRPNLASCPREPEPVASRPPGNATARASVKTPSAGNRRGGRCIWFRVSRRNGRSVLAPKTSMCPTGSSRRADSSNRRTPRGGFCRPSMDWSVRSR